ncbi:MAG TPA: hypothetical protein EYQ75_21650 [Planctomycetaceae bacterium]|nr:hypothetical protein [Planctomycetaceae bacterium]
MKNIPFHLHLPALALLIRLIGPPTAVGAELTLLDRLPKPNPDFTAQVKAALQSVPSTLRTRVADEGWKIELVRLIVDRVPSLRRRRPAGWPPRSGWENADAVPLPKQKRILIATHRFNGQGKLVETTRVAAVVRHEMGHAIDMVLGVDGTGYSDTDDYISAHTADRSQVPEAQRAQLAYYLRPSSRAARQESFAELIAMKYGGGTEGRLAEQLRSSLPKCSGLIEKLLAE